jgi:hypothetical protein
MVPGIGASGSPRLELVEAHAGHAGRLYRQQLDTTDEAASRRPSATIGAVLVPTERP